MDNRWYPILLLGFCFSLATCDQWELGKVDFIQVRLLSSTATGLNTAAVSAEALDLEVGQISDHGFIWSPDNSNPDFFNNDGRAGLGIKEKGEDPGFSTTLSNLLVDTRYFVRAYAKVEDAFFYSDVGQFTTGNGQVFTEEIIYESRRSLEMTGRITGVDAGIIAIRHGFSWSTTNTSPTIDQDEYIDLGNLRNETPFSYKLEGLISQQPVYIRAYADLNVNGQLTTTYGETRTFNGDLRDVWDEVPETNGPLPGRFLFSIGSKMYLLNITDRSFGAFDLATHSWEVKSIFEGLVYPEYSFVIEDKGYIIDDMFESAKVWQYDPGTDQWTQYMGFPRLAVVEGVVIGAQGKAYFGNGFVDGFFPNGYPESIPDWWEFDPSRQCDTTNLPGCWTKLEQVPFEERYSATALEINGLIYVGGGQKQYFEFDLLTDYFKDWWIYDPVSGTWTKGAELPLALETRKAALNLNGKGYLPYNTNFWEFQPETDSWITLASTPGFFSFQGSIAFDQRGYFLDNSGNLLKYTP